MRKILAFFHKWHSIYIGTYLLIFWCNWFLYDWPIVKIRYSVFTIFLQFSFSLFWCNTFLHDIALLRIKLIPNTIIHWYSILKKYIVSKWSANCLGIRIFRIRFAQEDFLDRFHGKMEGPKVIWSSEKRWRL